MAGRSARARGLNRRNFMKTGSAGVLMLNSGTNFAFSQQAGDATEARRAAAEADIGTIFDEVRELAGRRSFPLSFLEADYPDAAAYRRTVRSKIFELFHYEPPPVAAQAEVVERWEYDDYIQEKIVFSTTPWFRIPAYVLTPKNFSGKRPGIVDLHSHGGMFVYGKEKVMPMPGGDPSVITEYRKQHYGGRSTSLALCRRGYVVVSIDCFYFGERRTILADDLEKYGWDRSKYSAETVRYLNRRSGAGEGALARSLFWAGATWQGVAHWDDIRTVDYLSSRPDVDSERIGCLGISMGGDRTDYLAGLDERIACAVSVGWMSTLKPMIENHVLTHSYMHFLPGMTHYIDLPDLIGCMVPKPLMLQYCSRDQLYPLEGMKESEEKLHRIYEKAGARDQLSSRFYDLGHTFSLPMQEEAFDWLDRWLMP